MSLFFGWQNREFFMKFKMVFIKEKVRIKCGFSEFLREKYPSIVFYGGKLRKKKNGKNRAKKGEKS